MVSKKLDKNLKLAVFSLIVVQAIHSIEEYIYRFYEVFPIFKVYQKIFQIQNIDQAMFFAFNTVLILFLFIVFVIATSKRGNLYFVTGFAIIELLNGIYHFLWTVLTQEYFPGTISGIFFIPISLYILKLVKNHGTSWKSHGRITQEKGSLKNYLFKSFKR